MLKEHLISTIFIFFKCKAEKETWAFFVFWLKTYITVELWDNLFADRKAKSDLLPIFNDFENLILIFSLDTYSCVFNIELYQLVSEIVLKANQNFTLWCESNCILDQINQNLLHS